MTENTSSAPPPDSLIGRPLELAKRAGTVMLTSLNPRLLDRTAAWVEGIEFSSALAEESRLTDMELSQDEDHRARRLDQLQVDRRREVAHLDTTLGQGRRQASIEAQAAIEAGVVETQHNNRLVLARKMHGWSQFARHIVPALEAATIGMIPPAPGRLLPGHIIDAEVSEVENPAHVRAAIESVSFGTDYIHQGRSFLERRPVEPGLEDLREKQRERDLGLLDTLTGTKGFYNLGMLINLNEQLLRQMDDAPDDNSLRRRQMRVQEMVTDGISHYLDVFQRDGDIAGTTEESLDETLRLVSSAMATRDRIEELHNNSYAGQPDNIQMLSQALLRIDEGDTDVFEFAVNKLRNALDWEAAAENGGIRINVPESDPSVEEDFPLDDYDLFRLGDALSRESQNNSTNEDQVTIRRMMDSLQTYQGPKDTDSLIERASAAGRRLVDNGFKSAVESHKKALLTRQLKDPENARYTLIHLVSDAYVLSQIDATQVASMLEVVSFAMEKARDSFGVDLRKIEIDPDDNDAIISHLFDPQDEYNFGVTKNSIEESIRNNSRLKPGVFDTYFDMYVRYIMLQEMVRRNSI